MPEGPVISSSSAPSPAGVVTFLGSASAVPNADSSPAAGALPSAFHFILEKPESKELAPSL